MTRAEIIKELQGISRCLQSCMPDRKREALNMAIEALGQQTCDNCKFNLESDTE